MHFLHSSLSGSANLTSIVSMNSMSSDEHEVLLSFPDSIRLARISKSECIIHHFFYTETPFLWMESVDNCILALSCDHRLLILDKKFPFPKIKELQLRTSSKMEKSMFIYGDHHVCFVFDPNKAHFVNIETLEVYVKSFSRLAIEDVAFTEDGMFAFLLKPTTKGKITHKIVNISLSDQTLNSKPQPAPSCIGFIQGDSKYAFIKTNSIEYDQVVTNVPSVRVHSKIVNDRVVIQTNESELLVCDLLTGKKAIISKAPQMQGLWILNNLILCKDQNLKCHVIAMPDLLNNSSQDFEICLKYQIQSLVGANTVFDHQGNIAVSGENGTYIIKKLEAAEEEIGRHEDRYIVESDGIYTKTKEVIVKFDSPVTASAILDRKVLTAHDPCYMTLFNETLMHRENVTIDLPDHFRITSVGMSYSHIAVGISETNPIQNNVRGHIILMNSSFQRCGGDVRLPSAIRSMQFTSNGEELIIYCTNGISLSCTVKHGLIDSVKLVNPDILLSKDYRVHTRNTLIPQYSKCLSMIKRIPHHSTLDNMLYGSLSQLDTKSSQECLPAGSSYMAIEEVDENQTQISLCGKAITLKEVTGTCSTTLKGKTIIVVTSADKMISVYDDSLTFMYSSMLPAEPSGIIALGRTLILFFKDYATACRLHQEGVKLHKARLNYQTPMSLVIANNEYIWCVDDENVVVVLVYNRQSDRFELVSKRQLPVEVNCIAPLDDLTVTAGCNDGSILVMRIPMDDAIGSGSGNSVLELLWRGKTSSSIESIARVDGRIVYLTTDGIIGLLKPLGCIEDIEELQDNQDSIREMWSKECGFCLLDTESLGSQKGVLITELLNTSIELNEDRLAAKLNEIVRK